MNILNDFNMVPLAMPIVKTNVKRNRYNAEIRASVAFFIHQRQSACNSIKVNSMYSLVKNNKIVTDF